KALVNKLIPIADIITPNLSEAGVLCGEPIDGEEKMLLAAQKIGENYSGYILVKGGHSEKNADDLLAKGENRWWIRGERIQNPNTHGTGCTLSSAIACNLAAGYDMKEAVTNAKTYITGAIADGLDLGQGSGPLNHGYWLVRK
ncbi:MAG: PfkB family carbohydrate kinase, partial [Lachnospiraceae bacterium]|nr:PfkB family carbohydrate kinase [Lachnospiraceae bacterium]